MDASGADGGCPPRVRTSRNSRCGLMRQPACRREYFWAPWQPATRRMRSIREGARQVFRLADGECLPNRRIGWTSPLARVQTSSWLPPPLPLWLFSCHCRRCGKLRTVHDSFMMQEAAVEAAHVLFRRSYARGCRGVIGVRDWRCR